MAAAVVDPKQEACAYPYKNICGGVVAYKLIQALCEKAGSVSAGSRQRESGRGEAGLRIRNKRHSFWRSFLSSPPWRPSAM